MGFKSDREFLRNITIGAVGTRQVAAILREGGFRIIELERYSQSNKIWATKVKRLRVPDLLCLSTGIRIESRAKSSLKLTMSHAKNNPNRAWDSGLRDDDLVAFIKCHPLPNDQWRAAPTANLFRVADMRATQEAAGLSAMKAASEGSEIQLTWRACIPNQPGQVVSIEPKKINTVLQSGRKQSYRLISTKEGVTHQLTPYVVAGDAFGGEEEMIASVLPERVAPLCPNGKQYDFLGDLESSQREDVYAAAKALGFMPELIKESRPRLTGLAESDEQPLLSLEAAAALARLGLEEGWAGIRSAVGAASSPEVRMESVLIAAELRGGNASKLLHETAIDPSNPSELRAAAAWGMASQDCALPETPLLELIADEDELLAVHALVAASRLLTQDSVLASLALMGTSSRRSAGIAKSILASPCDSVAIVAQAAEAAKGPSRSWLLYTLATLGRSKCQAYLAANSPALLEEIEFFWGFHDENWTNRLDVADQIDYLRSQFL